MKIIFTDQMKRQVAVQHPPKRIISLVPSQSELLVDLGLKEELVGITKFCIHPEGIAQTRTRIGGTKLLKMERIEELQPDLIIGNKEENEQGQIEELAERYPVWMSDILTLEDSLEMVGTVGRLVDREAQATTLVKELRDSFAGLERWERPLRAAYFIWQKPYMVAAGGTFINEMMVYAGLENVFGHRQRYPVIALEELAAVQPEVILLSSEPYPFKEKHWPAFQEICPKVVIKLVDGELFSWYGSRLKHTVQYFLKLREELSSNLL